VRTAGIRTADIGIQGIEPMHEIGIDKEFERAIDGRWRGIGPVAVQSIQDFVGPDRLVAVPDQLENALALAREPQAALPAYSPGVFQCLFDTGIVIVLRIVGWTGWQ